MKIIILTAEDFQKITGGLTEIRSMLRYHSGETEKGELLLDIPQMCDLLKISVRTCQYYRDNNILPYRKINGRVYFSSKEIENLLNKNYVPVAKPCKRSKSNAAKTV